MRNFTLSQSGFFRLIFFVLFVLTPLSLFAQVCGTPGVDGPVAVTNSVNTYYPINGNVTLNAGAQSILLGSVPTADSHNNSFGTIPISVGDLILIIQMQDATINYSNSANYGSGTSNSGPDYLGGTGFTALGNTGIFEYVIATSNVPLGGGNLTFKGTGIGGGAFNSFFNANATTTRGKRTFQVIRVPQYSNLTLTANITTPPYNGAVGGVIAFNVSGTFNFAGYSIDGSARGFRGGYSPRAGSGVNDATTYVGEYTRDNISGKGEGIAGTPKYMWDGFNQVVNAEEGLPGGSSGRGAAANAGGGGNDHNTGGGGGGNGGFGGLGGAGWQGGGGAAYPDLTGAGRPGSKSYITTTTFPRLIMGGGGGAGDANDASSGVKGGVGGAIILVNAGNVLGDGFIYANGGNGAPGTYSGSPDGAGGGGAGGTVLLNVSNNSTSNIHVEAKGGAGGNTENDANNEHGPGGGGGGGIVCHNLSGTVTITSNVLGGAAGKSNAGNGITHGAKDGQEGYTSTFTVADVPPNLQVNANCFPVLGTTVKTLTTTSVCNSIDEKISYEIQIKNTGAGNAAGVVLDFSFPTGIEFDSATAAYSTDASGPSGALTNTATANNPVFGGFNIAQNGVVTITLVGKVAASISSGAHSSNAQALYLDPTRTTANSTRRITAFTNGYGTANKTYEGANQANVPGLNFNGNSTTADDITILALPVAPTATVTQTTCSVPTGRITVNTPANGTGISYTLVGTNPVTTPISNTTGVFSGLIPGTYTLTTTNAQGCTSSPNTGIVINTVADAPTVTGVTICQDGTGSLTATSACGAPNSTGAKMAGTGSSVNGTGTLVWSNPSQVISNNSSYAYATVNSGGDTTVITRYLQGTNFDFNIPTNATITGIQVTIGRYGSVNSASVYVRDNIVSLIKGGSVTSQNKSIGTNWSTNSTSVSNYGGTSDLWGTTWTPTEINDSTFGIALSASITRTRNNDITANVDYMQITVNYTVGGIEWYTTATGGSSIYTGASFNPVGVTGSGLTSTSTPGTRTYYASCPGTTNCRAAANFVINPRPTITGTTPTLRCGAGSVTLGASASTGTINWYATPTSTVSLGTGTSFTTPSLTTTTSYYVDATDNGCTTSTRTEVKATINTIPTINSTTEASRCGTGSVTLKATASTGTINWYATPTSTTSLGTGTDFTTESLSATTTYYVDVITAAGCSASSRIAVTAVINTASTIVRTSGTQNPTVCAGASIPTTVYTFGGSASNAIVSNLPAGLSSVVDTNAKTVTISGTPTVGGTYTITTAGHTSPCTEATISGTVTVNPTPSAPSASAQSFCSADNRTVGNLTATGTGIKWYTASTGGTALSSSTVLTSRTYYASQTSADGCESSRTAVVVTVNPTPSAPSASAQSFCSADNRTVGNLTATGTGIKWYTASTGGTALSSSTVLTSRTYYASQTSADGCESSRTAVVVTVNPTPSAPSASAQSFCSADNRTVGNLTATGTSIKWYTASTGGTALSSSTVLTSRTYYASQTSADGCESSRTAVVVTVNPTPSAPSASAQSFCSADNRTVGNLTATGTSIKWYTASTGGSALAVSDVLTSRTYYASQTSADGCESSRTAVVVTVNPTPSAPSASAQSFCSADNRTVGNLTATGTSIKWYTASTGGSALAVSDVLTSRTYYASQTSADGCESSRTAVVVTVNSTPSAPTVAAQTFCSSENKTIADLASLGASYKWYSALTGGTALAGTTVLATGTYYVSQSSNGCESTRSSVSVTVNATPSAPTVAAQTFCSSENKTIADLASLGASYKWYSALTGGTALAGTTVLATGTYYVSQSSNGCESTRASVSVTVNATPSAPTVAAQTFCSSENKTIADLASLGASYKWYSALTGGSALAGTTVLATGTYYVSQSSNGCESTRSSVSVTVNATPSAPTVAAQTFCSSENKTIGDLASLGASYKWYSALTGGTALAGTTVLATGTYYVSQSSNGCESTRASVSVTVNATPSAPTVAAQTFCSSENKTIADLASLGASYKWYSALTGGSALAGTTVLATGTYYVSQSSNGCESTRASVSVTVNATPSAPTVAAQTFCSSENKTIGDLASLGASYKWYSALTGGTALAGTTVLATGTYYVSQSSNGCESTRASVSVTVNATPSAPTVAAQTFCSSENKTIGDLASLGASYKWYSALTGGTALAGTTVLATGTYYVSQSSNGCESTRASVSVTVNPTPSAPTVAAQTFCSSENKTIADLASLGASYKWYSALTGGTALAGTTVLATGTYYVSQSSNGCESTRTAVVVTITTNPVKPILGSINQPTCSTFTGTFTITNYNSSYTYTISPNGATLNTATGVVTATKGIYKVTATLNSCASEISDAVEINSILCANADPFGTKTSGATATTVGNVKTNDTLNGVAVTADNTTVTPKTDGVLSVDASGVVTLAANAPSGSYSIVYQICEINTTNCKTATASVDVVNTLVANADSFGTKTSGATATTVGNVKTNDTLNGVAVTADNTTVTPKTDGVLSVDAAGVVTLAANAPSGSYSIVYQICEINTTNCKTATASVDVVNTLVANADPFGTKTSGATATTVGNVKTNDTLNGVAVTADNTTVTPKTDGVLSVDAAGVVTLAANAPSGSYSIVYQICEINTTNCKTATASVDVVNTLVANADPFGTKTSGATATTVGNVKTNDTLNGVAVTADNTTVTPKTDGVLSVDASGVVTLAANAPSGSYSIVYQICEINTTNCKTATASVDVVNTLVANADPFGTKTSGATATTVGNVKTNDTLNGVAVTADNTTVTPKTDGVLSVDAAGVVTLAANAPSGSYSIVYQICEINTTNCKTATASVDVVNALVANNDPFGTKTSGATATTVGNVKTNDTLNGIAVTADNTTVTPKTDGVLSVDASGVVTLAANAPSGSYSIVYQICEINTTNCKTATASVDVVNTLVANADPFGTKTSGATATTVGNVKTNDTLNGVAVTADNTTVTPKTDGVLSVDAAGVVTLAANAPSGSYSIVYQICEINTTNCKTATASVDVVNTLVANADPFGTKTSGATATTVGNVKTNDTLNGVAVTADNTTVTPKTDGVLSVDAAGVVTLAANAPSGSYSIVYQICEINTTNCRTATASVDVVNEIKAVKETTASINGNVGGTTVSLTANDTLNGNPVVIGTNSGEVNISIVGTLPTGLTLNANGTITVAPNTPAANYNVEYTICEVGANPSNCDTVISVVPVTGGDLVANADPLPSVTGSNTPQTLGGNVLDNDTKNGQPLNPADVILTESTPDPKGYLTLNPDGTITLGANAPAGNYELTYTICEKLNQGNCKSNTVTVTVTVPVIDAVKETTASINGNTGGTTVSLTANDTLDGKAFVIGTNSGEVTISIVGTLPTGLSLNANGTITVAANTPAANYNVEYTICDNNNSGNCDTVISVVPVTGGDLVANADPLPSVTGSNTPQTLGGNVLDNDTKNGQPLNPADVILTESTPDPKGYLTLNPDGTITLGANAPAGNYELTYTICEKLNQGNCKSNTVTVTVTAPVIDAVAETLSPSINGSIGGTTTDSVIGGDTLNGNPVVIGTLAGQVKLTAVNVPTGLTLNADGTITVAPNTASGVYNIEYRICEITNPSNCDTAISKVAVNNGTLIANSDDIPAVTPSSTGKNLGVNIFTNDTKNGIALDPSDVNLTISTPDPKGYLTVDSDGSISLGANAPAGDYELTYTICEKLNPGNCSSNTVRVTVDAFVIDAVEETLTPSINGSIGGTTTSSVIDNDTLNGTQAVIGTSNGQVKLTAVNVPAGLTLNADGTVTVAANTPSGIYSIEYSICENANPSNCDTAISKVAVNNGTLIANADTIPSVKVSNTTQNLGANIFTNDTKNGIALNPSDVNLTISTPDPKGYLTVNPDGSVSLGANAPAGDYELTYTICEKLNAGNCSSNTVRITVESNLVANLDSVPLAVGINTPQTLINVFANDTKDGNPLVPSDVILTTTIADPKGYLSVDANGNVILAPNAPAGDYELTYSICDKLNSSNCSTNVVKVTVKAPTVNTIVANNDEEGPIDVKKGMNATINIFANDLVNGVKPNASDVILTIVVTNPNVTLNADGTVSIAPNTPDGVYNVTYQICEAANTSNCSQSAVVKITVVNSVDPTNPEPPAPNQITLGNDTNISVDGINGDLEFVNVLGNDLINGQPINAADVIVKPLTIDNYFEWNADGTVSVKPNTPGGTYTLTYQVCEKADPLNCSTAVLTVFVEVPAIAVIKTATLNDENKDGFANAGETITYSFTVTNTGNVPLTGITINDPLPGVTVSGQAIDLAVNASNETNFTAVYKITQEDINRKSVSNQAIAKGSSVRGVVVEDKSDDSTNNGDNPTVINLDGCTIEVLKAFSPNGDGKNERFYIRGIECYPDNTVEIYNRWGVLVFSIDQYNNTDRAFTGYSNGRSTIKQTEGLPVGTYFYILKYKDSAKTPQQKSGYLYINK